VLLCGQRRRASWRSTSRRAGRPLRTRAPGLAAALTIDTRSSGHRQRLRLQLDLLAGEALALPGDPLLAISTSGNSASWPRWRRTRQGHDRHRCWSAQWRRQVCVKRLGETDVLICRAARAHEPRPGSAIAGAALPVRCDRRSTDGRTGMTPNQPPRPFALALRAGAGRGRPRTGAAAARRCSIGGAMMGTTLMVTDRRTSGTQLEDQSIELKAMTRVREARQRRPRQRDQLQPHAADHRRGARRRPDKAPSSRPSAKHRERARGGQRAGGDGHQSSLAARSTTPSCPAR
jgi:hypothetical protein